MTYDPKRLQGVSAYQEIGRDFAKGDRIQFTAPVKELGVANRDLASIVRISTEQLTARLDSKNSDGRDISFDPRQMRHFDHGYAVTSHSSQGVTAQRVLVNMDTRAHPDLINTRFAYVSVSRASLDAQLYTNDAEALGQRLSREVSKTSAIDFTNERQEHRKEQHVDNANRRSLRPETNTREATRERIDTPAEHERHYAPLNRELHQDDARHFAWRAENGSLQSYEHAGTRRHIHIDGPSGQFYDRHRNPISKNEALDHAVGAGNHRASHNLQTQQAVQQRRVDQSIGLVL